MALIHSIIGLRLASLHRASTANKMLASGVCCKPHVLRLPESRIPNCVLQSYLGLVGGDDGFLDRLLSDVARNCTIFAPLDDAKHGAASEHVVGFFASPRSPLLVNFSVYTLLIAQYTGFLIIMIFDVLNVEELTTMVATIGEAELGGCL